jgi:hypothetical protein
MKWQDACAKSGRAMAVRTVGRKRYEIDRGGYCTVTNLDTNVIRKADKGEYQGQVDWEPLAFGPHALR